MSDAGTVLAADVGRTSTRLAMFRGGRRVEVALGRGSVGVASPGGVQALVEAISQARAGLAISDDSDADAPRLLSVGAAGALTDPTAARAAARALRQRFGVPVILTSDLVAAHCGAFDAEPGVILIAGTGAVALGVGADGARRQVDGWGPTLGDLGGGAWIGRHGLLAVLQARVPAGPATVLTGAVADLGVPPADIASWITASDNPAQAMARFAPAVLAAAAAGDGVASDIVERAVDHLMGTASAASLDQSRVACVGGLTDDVWFAEALRVGLVGVGLQPTAPRGDALAGANRLAGGEPAFFKDWIHYAQ